jgi:hypothetical protein
MSEDIELLLAILCLAKSILDDNDGGITDAEKIVASEHLFAKATILWLRISHAGNDGEGRPSSEGQ